MSERKKEKKNRKEGSSMKNLDTIIHERSLDSSIPFKRSTSIIKMFPRKNVRAVRIVCARTERRPVIQQAYSRDSRILCGVDVKAVRLEYVLRTFEKSLARDKTKLLTAMAS